MAALAPTMAERNLAEQAQARFFEALHRYWGYESFRPGQENIVRSIAAGRDACVVMPTGGGKSLCYHLPAVLDRRRTVVVASPLIALMQDQVAQLEHMAIPAAVLNTSLSSDERSLILRRQAGLGRKPNRLRAHGCARWRHRRFPRGKRHRRRWLSRTDAEQRKTRKPGKVDGRRSACHGGHHGLRAGHQ